MVSDPGHGLPADLKRDAVRRLGVLGLVAAGLWTVAYLAARSRLGGEAPGAPPGGTDLVALAIVLLSLGMFAAARYRLVAPKTVLHLGLAYQVASALAVAYVTHTGTTVWSASAPALSWAGIIVLMFPAIVPDRPRHAAAAAILAASMDPLIMLFDPSGDGPGGRLITALGMHYPNYLCAAVAVVISAVMNGLGREVSLARELGSYRLEGQIGQGGMGVVFRASHRMLARPAAIKLIRAEWLTDARAAMARERFYREAQAVASLGSPHTVQIYDFGLTPSGDFYYVMELLEGLDFEQLIRRHGPLPPERAAFLLRQVCDSLGEAHALGLIHRDIKPSNLHVGSRGLRHDLVKVLDFGLVKSIAEDTADRPKTQPGFPIGTPAYTAPELISGDPATPASDVYAVGCVGYWLLTGRPVFQGSSLHNVLYQHLIADPARPSTLADHELSQEFEDLILACLAKDPDCRPPDAAALAARLDAIPGLRHWTQSRAAAWWALQRDGSGKPPSAPQDNRATATHTDTEIRDEFRTLAFRQQTINS
jgi:serine/threonine-protein kinase